MFFKKIFIVMRIYYFVFYKQYEKALEIRHFTTYHMILVLNYMKWDLFIMSSFHRNWFKIVTWFILFLSRGSSFFSVTWFNLIFDTWYIFIFLYVIYPFFVTWYILFSSHVIYSFFCLVIYYFLSRVNQCLQITCIHILPQNQL